jgi:uncharacterized protein (TIGR03118 family)
VFNTTTGFEITPGQPAVFIFASESGNITAWNMSQGTSAATMASTPDAVYKGLALASTSSGPYLYAANFHAGTIDVFDPSFTLTTVSGSFTDPNLPAGYAPFNVQEIGGSLYVTYALQDADAHDDVAGPRLRRRVHARRRLRAAADLPGPPRLAVGPRPGTERLRPLQRCPAGRQLRQRAHPRL